MTRMGSSSSSSRITRRDTRVEVEWDVTVEKIRDIDQQLQPQLALVYERVRADPTDIGERFKLKIRDISVNGAFIEGHPLPLLSRLALAFDIPDHGPVHAVGWILWRRKESCIVTLDANRSVKLEAGFGMVFEWISMDARLAIARCAAPTN